MHDQLCLHVQDDLQQSEATFWVNVNYYVTLRSLYGTSRSSVVCPRSVTLLHATQKVELFGNIFPSSNSPGTRTVCIKFLEKFAG